jgi:hypothetical protein
MPQDLLCAWLGGSDGKTTWHPSAHQGVRLPESHWSYHFATAQPIDFGQPEEVNWYRKLPIAIQALRLTSSNLEQAEEWCKGSIKGTKLPREKRSIDIQTLEGEMRAEQGDWIIKGVKGEFYPCKPDIFEATYEPCAAPRGAGEISNDSTGLMTSRQGQSETAAGSSNAPGVGAVTLSTSASEVPTPRTPAILELQRVALQIMADARGKAGDHEVRADLLAAIKTITWLERETIALRQQVAVMAQNVKDVYAINQTLIADRNQWRDSASYLNRQADQFKAERESVTHSLHIKCQQWDESNRQLDEATQQLATEQAKRSQLVEDCKNLQETARYETQRNRELVEALNGIMGIPGIRGNCVSSTDQPRFDEAWREAKVALSRALESPAVSPWRPIETAPKDGKWVLCWGDERERYTAFWSTAWTCWLAGPQSRQGAYTRVEPKQWADLPPSPEEKGKG